MTSSSSSTSSSFSSSSSSLVSSPSSSSSSSSSRPISTKGRSLFLIIFIIIATFFQRVNSLIQTKTSCLSNYSRSHSIHHPSLSLESRLHTSSSIAIKSLTNININENKKYHDSSRLFSTKTSSSSMATTSNKNSLSPLVNKIAVSKTIAIHSLTKEMEAKGQVVYSLCVGEPDYEPPAVVVKATANAAVQGLTKYTAVGGEVGLRKAIVADLKKRKGTKYTPEQVVVANGAKQAVIQSLMALVGEGDSVLVPSPYWPSYPDMVKMCGADVVDVPSTAAEGYVLTAQALRSVLQNTPSAKAIILCNPSNPTGGVGSQQRLEELAVVLRDYPNVFVISDEIYERLTYDVPHTSFASLPGMMDRTIVVNGFSKSHSMTGYRIGYSASPVYIAAAISKLQSQITSCASSVGQEAAKMALLSGEEGEQWMRERVVELKAKRDLAYSLISSIPNVTCPKPNGAFYLLPDVSHYYNTHTPSGHSVKDSNELCLELLRDEQVALVSGDAFGAEPCIRISYAADVGLLTEALTRLKRFLSTLQK